MKKVFSIIALLSLISFAIANNGNDEKNNFKKESSAQTISISGQVVDFVTGEVLTGVQISIEGTELKSFTDFEGNFEFKNVTKGEYNLIASFISYKNSLIENLNCKENINIKLQSEN